MDLNVSIHVAWEISNDDISGTGRPIDFVFDSRIGFSRTSDRYFRLERIVRSTSRLILGPVVSGERTASSTGCVVLVRTGSAQTCSLFDGVPLTQSTGYLSSLTAAEVGVGTAACPWIVDAPAGQRVNLTLFAFLPATSVDDAGCRGPAAGWTVVVVDGNITLEVPACSATAQPVPDGRLVYSSHGSKLRVHLEHVQGPFDVRITEHTIGYILIRYQGMV